MRIDRFRYRAWNKVNKEIHTGLPYSHVGRDTFEEILKYPQIYEVMQCADVSDNDGVLVFEGDYLSDGKTIWCVKYSQTMSGFCAEAVGGYIPADCKIFSLYHLCSGHNKERSVSVVGNMYEHTGALSELLNYHLTGEGSEQKRKLDP